MVKKSLWIVMASLLAASSAMAQDAGKVTTAKDRPDTVKIAVSGAAVMDYVWRSPEVTFFTSPTAPGVGSDDENTFEGYAAARLDVGLQDNVNGVIEFGTKRVDGGALNPFGNAAAEDVLLREANVTVGDLIVTNLSLQLGITTWDFDVQGKGNSFAFDPRHSQSIARNVGGNGVGAPEELESVGAVATYVANPLTLDIVFLPAAIEGGSPGADESLYAVDAWYNLDRFGAGSRAGGILAISSFGGPNTGIITLGGGTVITGVGPEGLQLYGEAYLQFGDAGTNAGGDVDAEGKALQLGGEYRVPQSGNNLWVGANITWRSGDDDATDDQEEAFLSYENVNDLLILEDMYFGLDWDTNVIAFKVSGGAAFSVQGGQNNVEVSGIVGIAKAAEDIAFASGDEDGLGNEIDIRAKWLITKQVSFNAAAGILVSSNVVEEAMGGSANSDSEDSASLYTVGADLKF